MQIRQCMHLLYCRFGVFCCYYIVFAYHSHICFGQLPYRLYKLPKCIRHNVLGIQQWNPLDMKYYHLCVQSRTLVVDILLSWIEFSMSCTGWDVMKPVIYIIMWLCISIWRERHILLFSIGMGLIPVPSPSFYDCIQISYSCIIISDQTLCPNIFMIAVT